MSDFPDPADLTPGDLIFQSNAETREVFTQYLFTVEANNGPDQNGYYEIVVRCPQKCFADDCRPPDFRHYFGLAAGDFLYAKDVTWA